MFVIENQSLRATFKQEGGELCSVVHLPTNTEYMWQADAKFWKRHAPVLFPIVGRLKNDTYIFEGKNYTLSQHGFARDMTFEVIEHTSHKITFELCSNNTTLKNYPFSFQLRLGYELQNNTLIHHYEVKNTEKKQDLLFSIGAHPAFALPEGSFENYYFVWEKTESLNAHNLSSGLRDGTTTLLETHQNKLLLHPQIFDADALVFTQIKSDWIALKSHTNPDYCVKVQLNQCPYLGLWSKPHAPFVCIEPWWGITDSTKSSGLITEKEGIIKLETEKTWTKKFQVSFG
jgi:galactose mutarotase-like enzyme